jgi:hypothetical protein
MASLLLPNFLIVGAPRSGTTWLHRNLRQHPEVYMPRRKELHFFDRDYDRGLEYYARYFARARDETALGEATPSYLHRSYLAARIRQDLPGVRLIASLRNPVDRLYSRYWNAKFHRRPFAALSFEDMLRRAPGVFEVESYYDHLVRYYESFSRKAILILIFDDLLADPAGFLRQAYEFLGVRTDFAPSLISLRVNASAAKEGFAKRRSLWHLQRVFTALGLGGTARAIQKWNTGDLPAMNADTRRWLINDIFREKNRKLAELIGRDLSQWNEIESR